MGFFSMSSGETTQLLVNIEKVYPKIEEHKIEDGKHFKTVPEEPIPYTVPKSWPYPILPRAFVPYGELMRISKPIGIMNIYFPYLFGTIYAALITPSLPPITHLLKINTILFLACFTLRSLGCCWNDIIDADLDRQVFRCRLRPMARGAISTRNGYLFTLFLTFIWLAILSQVSLACVTYSIPLIFMVIFYPFAKRITDYAQVVLGVTLSWGVLIGCLAMQIDPLRLVTSPNSKCTTGGCLVGLYLIYTLWTVEHDVIYAFQDLEDDIKAGIKGMAVRFQHHSGFLLTTLAMLQVALFLRIGHVTGAGVLYFLFAVGGNVALHVAIIKQVDLKSPEACLWWFQTGCLLFGATTFAGLFGEYLTRLLLL